MTSALRWVPLESNPELFSSWSSSLGLDTTKYEFCDVFGLDDELLAMVPQPVHAVLLLFPVTEAYEAKRHKDDEGVIESDKPEGDGELLWFKQTIGNACGTIGLLHALANTSASETLPKDSPLATLFADARPLAPVDRAALLQTSKSLAQAHTQAAASGQTAAPSADDKVDLHFVAFVRHPKTGDLVELDGRRKGPVNRKVKVEEQKDLLKLATSWIRDSYMALDPTEVNYNLIALSEVQQ
ncbi:putative ubiquitin thiolesterase L3 [Acaromyces ingoldii]|uniref:Ubiquitin carboxyl-terminal hydrolase n=1 Tax=Acaromyces ingoldii TaxID=215250 RepID=A0A316YV39_9BASI|nr:putative ubiquitin thiolesterase L3 [Acaromyces ingoldii]PWN93149.1 putative ubiquitin thiolesterase L3 [Acaromyces ingoldii]